MMNVAVFVSSCMTDRFKYVGWKVTARLVTVGAALTVTVHVAVLLPSTVVTVIFAVPVRRAVTRPVVDTVATLLSLLDQVNAAAQPAQPVSAMPLHHIPGCQCEQKKSYPFTFFA